MKVLIYLVIGITVLIIVLGISTIRVREPKASKIVIDSCVYQGHEYFIFNNKGVIHNPECKCCYNIFE